MKALVVAGETDGRQALAPLLRAHGYAVTCCTDGAAAIAAIDQHQFQLALIDHCLPDHNGLALCRLLRSRPGGELSSILIICSGSNEEATRGPAPCDNTHNRRTEHPSRAAAEPALTSRFPEPETVRELLEAGADDYLCLPLDQQLLAARLAVAEHHRQLRQQRQHGEEQQLEQQLLREELEQRVEERTRELARALQGLRQEMAERERVQAALQQSELEHRAMFENAHDAMIIYSIEDEVVLDLNRRACLVYGYHREELIGQPLCLLTGEASLHEGRSPVGSTNRGVTIHLRKDREPITIDVNTTPINYQGRTAALSINRDITEQRLLEHRLRQAQKLEALGQLAGTIAHDFNNFVTAILGTTELLRRRLGADHPLAGDLALIGRASQSAADLTRSLLAYARRRMLRPHDLDLGDLVQEMLPMLRHLLPSEIALRHNLRDDIGNVAADRSQMEQVIMNLVTNARDAMPEGGVILIETGNRYIDDNYVAEHPWANVGSHVYVAVSDNGIGMDSATQGQIFDIFFTTKESGKGTGLGLASVYGSVKQHNGIIDVHSEPGKGSTFTVLLPEQEPRAEAPADAVTAPAEGCQERVLVVEDYDDLREVVADSVRSLGYQPVQACDGVEALAILERATAPVRVVLTDMTMPRMGGHELFLRSREIDPGLGFIFCTGHAGELEDLTGCEDARAAYLEKPFTIDTLAQRLRSVLDHGAAGR